jgi:Basic region leucine zipper
MVHSDRNHSQEAIANLNSISPLIFPDTIGAEDLVGDIDLFTNTEFFDFDYGVPSSFTSLDSVQKQGDVDQGNGNSSRVNSISNDTDLTQNFNFLARMFVLSETVLTIEPLLFGLGSLGSTNEEPSSKRQKATGGSPAKVEGAPLSTEDVAHAAAEEDKRRRNTLASARFRAKKKMREQALEKDHKEMTAKIEKMENRIKELELENKWLRGLVVQNKP